MSSVEPLRDDQHRFAASLLGEAELFEAVAGTARYARSVEPELLTQAQFDKHRAAAGFPDAPTAKVVAWRLRDRAGRSFPWRQLVSAALESERPDRVMIARTRSASDAALSVPHLRSALTMVAGLREQHTLGPYDYEETRERLLAIYRRRAKLHVIDDLLPTLGQIERIARNEADERDDREPWDIALELAGLEPRPGRRASLSVVEALLLFAEETDGAFCSRKQLMLWARDRGLAVEWTGGKPWQDYLRDARARRRSEGLVVRRKTALARDATAKPAEAYEQLPRRRNAPTRPEETAVEAVTRYVESLTGKARPSRAGYLTWRRTNPNAPAPSGFVWSDVLAEVQKDVARRRRSRSS